MSHTPEVLVIGCGIFGITAALEIRRRGSQVHVIDPGPLPHPLAASTDISKVVRMEYGSDDEYMDLVGDAIAGWKRWNIEWEGQLPSPLYHATGVTMLARQPMMPPQFEFESFQNLQKRQLPVERLHKEQLTQRYPAWNPETYVDGFFNANAGYVESGRVVAHLVAIARREGVTVEEGATAERWTLDSGRITEVIATEGQRYTPHEVVLCAGSWTQQLLPELKPVMRATGHPIFHLKPSQPQLFTPPHFVVFTADISGTGWYGFPLHPTEGVVKVANHGVGVPLDPAKDPREVSQEDIAALRAFLACSLPALANDPIVSARRCLYSDTLDGHLWIDHHPQISNLTVSAGGSGHAMKMAPLLGTLTAAAMLGEKTRWSEKFRWRHLAADTEGLEEARFHGKQ